MVQKLPQILDPDQDDYQLTGFLGEAFTFTEYKLDRQANTLSIAFNPKLADAKSDLY